VRATEPGRILKLPDGPKRTAALAAWFQGLYGGKSVPVLVGGAAVALHMRGAYTTEDLGFVGTVPPSVAEALEEAGFRRDGRNWFHESGEIFIEIPSAALDPEDGTAVVVVDGHRVVTQSVEGLIVDRLAFWKVRPDAASAFRLWKQRERVLDLRRLTSLARSLGAEKALESLKEFTRRLAGREPSSEEIEQWASQEL
jgi:hypothetical protein